MPELVTCPNCGEQLPSQFRLCGFCGAALAPHQPPVEVRKTVTIVFSDLKGSTALGESLDSEALREVMSRYFAEMRTVLERHGGTVEKFIGDAVMAVFGLPHVHEDDALRAVRAAADMQAALASLNDELERQWGVRLSNRTGVNTGEVVAGDPAAGQRLVTGDAVNVAARLEQAAPANEILIGHETYRLVRATVDVEPVEPLPLKGKSEPVAAYRLAEVKAPPVGGRGSGRLVGRSAELTQLSAVFDRVSAGRRPALVTVMGDAGMGKSTLIDEFIHRLPDGVRVLSGRCLSYGEGITFWPLAEVVREAAGITDQDSLEQAHARLSALLPGDRAAVDRLAAACGLSEQVYPVADLIWAARRLVDRLAQAVPVVLRFEDIHWAEPTFLDLVEQVAAADRQTPVMVVCSARRDLYETRSEWDAAQPNRATIELSALSSAESVQVMDQLVGIAGLDARLGHRIVDAADGNPLYIEQFVSMLIDEGRLSREDDGWRLKGALDRLEVPPGILALLSARLDRLAQNERLVLERGAIIGQVFYGAAVTDLSPETLRAQVETLLSALIGRQLIAPSADLFAGEDAYRFGHGLIRDTAYQGLLKRTRAELHAAFAEWLEQVAGSRLLEIEEIVGYHFEQAHRYRLELGPLDEEGTAIGARAAARLAAPGRRAFERGDMPAAANLLGRATGLLEALDPGRLELLPDLAEALLDTGQLEPAAEVADDAVASARRIGDDRLAADASLVRLLVAYVTDADRWTDKVLTEAQRAIPVLESVGDQRGLAKAWRLIGSVRGTSCRYGLAEEAVRRSIDHARLAGDQRQEMRNLPSYAMSAMYGPLPVPAAIERCQQILEQAPGDLRAAGIVRCTLAQLHALVGRFDEARHHYRRGRQVFRELGGELLIASTSLDSARVELLAGDAAAALAELEPDYAALEAMGERYLRSTLAALLAEAHELAGNSELAAGYVQTCRELAAPDDIEAQSMWRSLAARRLARAGDFGQAELLANEAVDLTAQTDGLLMQGNAQLVLAQVMSLAGKHAAAESAAGRALDAFRRKGATILADRCVDLLTASARSSAVNAVASAGGGIAEI